MYDLSAFRKSQLKGIKIHSLESIMVSNICQNNLIRSFQYYKVELNKESVLD